MSEIKNAYTDTTVILTSDIHLCHVSWYGVDSPTRIEKMINDLNAYREKVNYSKILMLGDYSLDFWVHSICGSWINQKLSNTKNIIKDYFSRLDCQDYCMIPGNHEQYSNEQWKEITGFDRQFYTCVGGYLFIMLDNFSGNLDPKEHSDGTYTLTDLDYVKEVMALYPDAPVVLCAHWIDPEKEAENLADFIKNEPRVLCMFVGHDHSTAIDTLGDEWGNKKIIHLGNYSYVKRTVNIKDSMWGWRVLKLSSKGIDVSYYTPQSTLTADGELYTNTEGYQDAVFIENPLTK